MKAKIKNAPRQPVVSRVLYPIVVGAKTDGTKGIYLDLPLLTGSPSFDGSGLPAASWAWTMPTGCCLALHPVGFALPTMSPSSRCALTAPFHPYPVPKHEAVCFLWHFPYPASAFTVYAFPEKHLREKLTQDGGCYPPPWSSGARTFLFPRKGEAPFHRLTYYIIRHNCINGAQFLHRKVSLHQCHDGLLDFFFADVVEYLDFSQLPSRQDESRPAERGFFVSGNEVL